MNLITINKGTILSNAKQGTEEPPIRVARTKSGKGEYGSDVSILDADGNEVARLIYSPHEPIMSCGARLVLQTNHEARINR